MQAQSIKRNFGDLTYFVTGSGPALLGLSGFGCSHYNYIDLLPELTKNFTVVLIGNRGIGESSKTEANYNLKDVACDALAVMDHLKVQTFGLMGISMGGFIAQELYALAPLKISAISFMCTLSSGADFTAPAHLTEEGLRLFDTFDIATQAEYSTMATVHPTLKEKNPAQYKRIVDLRIENKTGNKASIDELVRQNIAAIEFLNSPHDLSQIKCPVLAMAGACDRFVSPLNVKAFKKNIKQCMTTLIDETDHFFFLEKPAEVSAQLSRFFKEVL